LRLWAEPCTSLVAGDPEGVKKREEVSMKSKISTKREDFPAKKRWPKTGI
jgi:hypothetical protein